QMSQTTNINTRQKILEVATSEFFAHGFRGASVREICSRAGASANAITYHFGSKEKLYREILDGFAQLQVTHAKRTLAADLKTQQEFELRLEVFFDGLLESYLANREVLLIALREFEQLSPDDDASVYRELVEVNFLLSKYIRDAKAQGFVKDDVDADIVAGILLDRLISQARFAHTHKPYFKVSTLDPEYRAYWIRATLAVIFTGINAPNK
ncbi:MAG: TetR/AcrR family transcriptional regulator, partial [Kordiimonadaceae bacterium]|nr:TetR/AcrR family transcriptional regulator [Kordiimonadaceae bacterium]